MKALGFRKTGATWHRDLDEMVQVLNIQKSPYADQFYINVGVYLKSLGRESRPTERHCHIRFRAEQVLGGDERFDLNRLLDFTEQTTSSDRYADLQILIEKSALSWLDENMTEEALSKTLAESEAQRFFVQKEVRNRMGRSANKLPPTRSAQSI